MTRHIFKILAWLTVVFIVLSTLVPLGMRPQLGGGSAGVERFVAFAVAGLLLGLAYPNRFLQVAFFTIVLAFGLEALQQFAADRHGRFSDALMKATGGLAGVFVADLFHRWVGSRPPFRRRL